MIHVYTIVYDNASFLELQFHSFRKHFPLQRFIVIDNAPNPEVSNDIKNFVTTHQKCYSIRVANPRFDNGGLSHQRALQTALDHMEGISIICDPDVFVLKPFMESMDDYEFAGLMQGTPDVRYLWPGFMIVATYALKDKLDLRGALVNPNDLNDFIVPDPAAGWTWEQYPYQIQTRISTDSGGLLCRYIQKHNPKIRELSLDFCTEICDNTGIIPVGLQHKYSDLYHFWVIGGGVLHSGRLSNWDNRPSNEVAAKSELVREIIEHYLR